MSDADQIKYVLKFCYRGSLSYIFYKVGCGYQKIINMVSEHFHIPAEFTACLQISNINGYVFEQHLFEYFILLFPSPQIVFYIRPGYKNSTIITNSSPERLNASKPFGSLRPKKRPRNDSDYGAPVKRQNCFLGSLPTEASDNKFKKIDYIHHIAKRQRLNEQRKPTITRCKPKRSIRV